MATRPIRYIFRTEKADSVIPQAPFRLRGKQMFDAGDLLIATFEKTDEAERILTLINSCTVLTGAATEAIRLIDDDVDNALDARIVLYSALRLGVAEVQSQREAEHGN
jgi:hypothetical protein